MKLKCRNCPKSFKNQTALNSHITKAACLSSNRNVQNIDLRVVNADNLQQLEILNQNNQARNDFESIDTLSMESSLLHDFNDAQDSVRDDVFNQEFRIDQDHVDAHTTEANEIDDTQSLDTGLFSDQDFQNIQDMDIDVDIPIQDALNATSEITQEQNLFRLIKLVFKSFLSKDEINEMLDINRIGGFNHGLKSKDCIIKFVDSLKTIPYKSSLIELKKQDGTRLGDFPIYHSSIIDHIKSFLDDKHYYDHMEFLPQKCYESGERIYGEIASSDWFYQKHQELIEEFQDRYNGNQIRLLPIVLSSDATLLNNSGRMKAHPLYFTLGNLPFELRSKSNYTAIRVLAYLPSLEDVEFKSDAEKRDAKRTFFQYSLKEVLQDLIDLSQNGILLQDCYGGENIYFPVLYGFAADYEEVAVRICNIYMNYQCPTCLTPKIQFDKYLNTSSIPLRNLQTERSHYTGMHDNFSFLRKLPRVDIYQSILIDELHTISKGVFAHLLEWLEKFIKSQTWSPSKNIISSINSSFKGLQVFQEQRVFRQGIFNIANITARENLIIMKNIAPVLFLVFGKEFRGKPWKQYVLSFKLLAQWYMLISSRKILESSIDLSCDILEQFFQSIQVYKNFSDSNQQFWKLHSLLHIKDKIISHGSMINQSTQIFERGHIIHVKQHEEHTNHRNQMEQIVKREQRSLGLEIFERHTLAQMNQFSRNKEYVSFHSQDRNYKVIRDLSSMADEAIILRELKAMYPRLENFEGLYKVRVYKAIEHNFTIAGDPRQKSDSVMNKDSFHGRKVQDFLAVTKNEWSSIVTLKDLTFGQFICGINFQIQQVEIELIVMRPLKLKGYDQQLNLQTLQYDSSEIKLTPIDRFWKKIQICKHEDLLAICPYTDHMSFCCIFK